MIGSQEWKQAPELLNADSNMEVKAAGEAQSVK